MSNPYAPPRATVADVSDPRLGNVSAERGTRLAASMLDGIIFGAMVYAPFLGGAAAGGMMSSARSQAGPVMTTGLVIGIVIGCIGLIIWSWLTIVYVKRNGQSIGKKIVHIKVLRSDGSPISLPRLFFLRNIVNAALSIIPFYGLIDVLFIFGEPRRCLHDKIADTIVVKA